MLAKTVEDSGLEDKNEDFQDTEGKTDKDEAEDLTAVEGSHESFIDAVIAEVSDLDVGGGGDHHADVAGKHGGEGTNEEAESSVGEGWVVVAFFPWLVDSAEEDGAEENTEDSEVQVLFLEESFGTLSKLVINKSFEKRQTRQSEVGE